MAERIAVIGAGAWGTALAALLTENGHAVRMWVRESDIAAAVSEVHENPVFLPGIRLPEKLRATTISEEALDGADLLLMTVPSRWTREICAGLAPLLPAPPPVCSVVKGLEIATGKRISEVIREELPGLPAVAALSGPNLAPEIARGLPAATTIASADARFAARLQGIFMNARFRPYTSSDITGVEICGAVKNVIAIAAGICEGLGYGDNAKAGLMTRALAEIGRLVVRLGGQAETVAGLAGIGDLITTCASPISRNHRVGLALGKGQSYEALLGESGSVAEGVPTTEAVIRLARRLDIELPICEQVYAILFAGRSAEDATRTLMTREPRSE